MFSKRADTASGRKPRAPYSITARLALLYAVLAFAMLLVTMAFLYLILLQGVERADFYFVADKVQRLEWILRNHPDDFAYLAQEVKWGAGPHQRPQSHTFYSRILDDRGRLVIETEGMAEVVPSTQFPTPPVNFERISKTEVVQRWQSPRGRAYCVLSTRVRNGPSGPSWVIQVAMDDDEEAAMIANVQRGLLAVLFIGTLASAGLGCVVARRGMKPLRDMAVTAEHITADRLDERIDPARQPEELAALATALNRMLGRLESSFGRISQFTADAAHELRTPIYNLMGEAEVALSINRRPEEYRCVLESSLEELERLTRMINEMLFIAHADDPQQHVEKVRLDARREIEAVTEFYDALIEAHGVTVTVQGHGEIEANPLLFRRALTNLLSNALRYTPGGGKIVLSVEPAGDNAVAVKVTDSGSGIRPEYLRRICDRLYCADRMIDGHLAEHTGLGLSIVKSIVELHGGSMTIDSVPGMGTTVLMRFKESMPAAA